MANSMFPGGTAGAGASNPSKGGKPSVDSRGPQEKGKPAHTTAHRQVGRGSTGPTERVPNRSGSVRTNQGRRAAGSTDAVQPVPKSMGGINSKMKAPPNRRAR